MKHAAGCLRLAGALAALLLVSPLTDAQWTQFGGPHRNFHCPADSLAASWPEAGPPVVWRRAFGDGYSGVLVDDDKLYTLFRRGGNEVVTCLSRADGTTIWEHSYAVETTSSAQQFGDGPSATPILVGDRLVSVGVGMDVCCLDKATGEVLWYRDIMEEFELPMPGRGYSPSPVAHAGLVILPLGGTGASNAIDDTRNLGMEDGSVAAFDLESGTIAWASQNFPGSKASPILIEHADRTQLVVFMGNELAGLDPEYGDLLWRFEHPTDYGFNCSTPVWDGVDTLICSSAYGNSAEAVQLVATGTGIEANKKWSSRRLSIHFTNMLLVDGRVYGVSGISKPGFLTCLDAGTGEMLWRSREFSKANLLYAGGPFVVYDEDGVLALTTFEDDGPEIHGRLEVTDSHGFTAPTLVGTDLYVRDRRHLTAFDLSEEGMDALRRGKGATLEPERPNLPDDIEALLGVFETDSPGAEPTELRLLVRGGWFTIQLDGREIRLALQAQNGRWEFVEDRTSGSTPRTIELLRAEEGEAVGFSLRSPAQGERHYRRRPR